MKKQTIKINESQLRKMVREVLKEDIEGQGMIPNQDGTWTGEDDKQIYSDEEVQASWKNSREQQKKRWNIEKQLSDKLIKSNPRIYRHHLTSYACCDKVFNRGMGALVFVEFLVDEKTILVNKLLARRTDLDRIKSLFPDWNIEFVELGYPDWYSIDNLHSVRKKDELNESKLIRIIKESIKKVLNETGH